MNNNLVNQDIAMSDRDFNRFRELIYEQCGINLTKAKKTMLTARLQKRLRSLNMVSFGDYYDYVSSVKGRTHEIVQMLDVVSTNKTDFFREPKHFESLTREILPGIVRSGRWRPGSRLNVWSAGCSSGEEPYTIAMVLAEFMSSNRAGDFSVLATDISTRVLERAKKGIYAEDITDPVPPTLKRNYLMRGTGARKGFCRIVPELRSRVRFERLNLNNGRDFGIKTRMDIIFCRNVIIYFNRETQKRLFKKFYEQILPGGYLFIGHSESLHGINDRFRAIKVAIYRKLVG